MSLTTMQGHATVLRRWVRKFGSNDPDAFPGKGQLEPDDEELRSLKREVAELKAERDILKKAAAWLYVAVVIDLFSRRVVGWPSR